MTVDTSLWEAGIQLKSERAKCKPQTPPFTPPPLLARYRYLLRIVLLWKKTLPTS